MKSLLARVLVSLNLLAGALSIPAANLAAAYHPSRVDLAEGWALARADQVKQSGEAVSSPGYDVRSWTPARVPETVLAALSEAGRFPDLYFGKNLAKVPGTWPFPLDVSIMPMPPASPFRKPYWYRTEFTAPAGWRGKQVQLHLLGVNYRAEAWLNGKKISGPEEVKGTYAIFELDVTGQLRPGEKNALALLVYPPRHRDLAITWVDWNPAPPDRNMGLWREVFLTATGPVALRHPFVKSKLKLPGLEEAELTVFVNARNHSNQPVSGVLEAEVGEARVEKPVSLGPAEEKEIELSPGEFPALRFKQPRLWWPAPLGEQNLYRLSLKFRIGKEISDQAETRFGIREVQSELSPKGHRVFKVNGKRVLIRGAGWAPDMLLRKDLDRLAAQIRYVKEMNLNAIRLEGKLESDEFYDLCDREGIFVIAGWCCCHHWERWRKWDKEDHEVAAASLRSQALRLRNHPCLLLWMNGSDNPPPPEVEKMYLDILEKARWPNPVVSSATEKPTPVSGPTGVKMTGPYDWVPPVYWYEDKKRGGAFGFNTETSPGPAPPPVASLKKFLPEDHLWPIDGYWDYHAGRGMFADIAIFTKALEARYGKPGNIEDFAWKSQAMAYEGERAMFEAYARNKYEATGVIQWMLNDAWPSLIWHLYDYYLRPGGGYFGTKKACEPLHLQYSYDDRTVVAVNNYHKEFKGLIARARIFDLTAKERWSKEVKFDLPPDSSRSLFIAPPVPGLSSTYFLKLELLSPEGGLLSDNFYWLSLKPDRLNHALGTWFYTPARSYADFTGLESLPEVSLSGSASLSCAGDECHVRAELVNPGPALAFLVRARLMDAETGEEILPAFYSDNYFYLLPGESKRLTVSARGEDLAGSRVRLDVDGWNVKSSGISPAPAGD